MPLRVSSHPVVQDCLAGLRDRSNEPEEFRALSRRIIPFLLYEATVALPVRQGTVSTPLRESQVSVIDRGVVAIPVLRAGLGILSPLLELVPTGSVCYLWSS